MGSSNAICYTEVPIVCPDHDHVSTGALGADVDRVVRCVDSGMH